MLDNTLVSVNNLSRYYGEHIAVNRISFELATGDILGFLGPNGAGKSTTMQMLSGNLAPSAGEIIINGIDLLEQPKAAKQSLGYLPDVPPLYNEMTVEEYLHFCAKIHRLKKTAAKHCVRQAIDACGLGTVKQRLIGNLSKGYQQRTGIAQAILHSPPVIILDEPTVGLDPIQVIEIRKLIKQLGQSHGIILCSHILPEVQAVCNRVQIIHQGSLVYNADMQSLIQQQDSGWFEVSLKHAPDIETLLAWPELTALEKTGACNYLLQSPLAAEILCEKLVQQAWGLASFCPHRQTLEQKFIELTLNPEVSLTPDALD